MSDVSDFNSIKVQLRRARFKPFLALNLYFNSIKVQLRLESPLTIIVQS